MTTPQAPQTYADVVQHTQGPWRVSGAALDGFRPIMAPGGVIVALVSTIAGYPYGSGYALTEAGLAVRAHLEANAILSKEADDGE